MDCRNDKPSSSLEGESGQQTVRAWARTPHIPPRLQSDTHKCCAAVMNASLHSCNCQAPSALYCATKFKYEGHTGFMVQAMSLSAGGRKATCQRAAGQALMGTKKAVFQLQTLSMLPGT